MNLFKEIVTPHKTQPFHNLLVFLFLVDFFFTSSSSWQCCDYLIASIICFLNQGLVAGLIEFPTSLKQIEKQGNNIFLGEKKIMFS